MDEKNNWLELFDEKGAELVVLDTLTIRVIGGRWGKEKRRALLTRQAFCL